MYEVRINTAETIERDLVRGEIPPDEAKAFAESALAHSENRLAILKPGVREILQRILAA